MKKGLMIGGAAGVAYWLSYQYIPTVTPANPDSIWDHLISVGVAAAAGVVVGHYVLKAV